VTSQIITADQVTSNKSTLASPTPISPELRLLTNMSTIADSDLIAKMSVAAGVLVTCTLAMHLWNNFRYSQALSKFPMANDQWDAAAKVDFLKSGESILAKGLALVRTFQFRVRRGERPIHVRRLFLIIN
jgi:hypothetical protein